MTATIAAARPLPTHKRKTLRRKTHSPKRSRRCNSSRDVLGRYTGREGRPREIVLRAGAGDSALVIDRDALTLGDRRLVAHVAADEPTENARLVCGQYLADPRRPRCRKVTPVDLLAIPCFGEEDHSSEVPDSNPLVDKHGRSYHLEAGPGSKAIHEMRWQQYPPEGRAGPPRPRTIRDVIGALESYEPARTLTRDAVRCHRHDPKVSVSALRSELERFYASRFVLNRGLREAALAIAQADGLSMSEIARRCGRVKYDSRGNVSGDSSWLSRRLGLSPEGGETSPTPWCDSDVLALIAREGLGVSPNEVELG